MNASLTFFPLRNITMHWVRRLCCRERTEISLSSIAFFAANLLVTACITNAAFVIANHRRQIAICKL